MEATTIPIDAVTLRGRPCPDIVLQWSDVDRRPEDPIDPDYADRAWVARVTGPEPINVIEVWIHDLTSFGRPEFVWEVDGTSEWAMPKLTDMAISRPVRTGDVLRVPYGYVDPNEIGATGHLGSVEACLVAITLEVREAVARWWSEYDD